MRCPRQPKPTAPPPPADWRAEAEEIGRKAFEAAVVPEPPMKTANTIGQEKKMKYMVQATEREAETFTSRKKADKRARELSRAVYGIVVLAILKHDCPEACPNGRWDVIERYSRGAVTLHR